MRVWHSVSADFDDPNLLGTAGLVPALALAERAGLHRLVTEHVSVPGLAGSNAAVKVTAVVAGMVAGADSFEDLDLLRHGAMGRVFTGLRAPTTLGTHLRAYAFGHVRQLDAVASRVLGNLAAAVPRLLAGAEQVAYLDVDDTVRATHGYAKQGAAYGYSRVKGLNAQLATLSTPAAAPVIAGTRLRRGNVASAHGAARLISDALTTARRAGVTGTVTVRADSAYYARAVIAAARRGRARFWRDRTEQPCGLQGDRGHRPGRMDPDPLPERGLGRSRAAAGLRRRGRRGRVHRVHLPAPRRAGHRPADRAPGPPAQPRHRHLRAGRAVRCPPPPRRVHRQPAEHARRGGHPPRPRHRRTGHRRPQEQRSRASAVRRFTANAAWTVLAAIAFNLTRATGAAASTFHAKARTATVRRQLITLPGRIARSARRLRLHLPTGWPWKHAFTQLFTSTCGPPARPPPDRPRRPTAPTGNRQWKRRAHRWKAPARRQHHHSRSQMAGPKDVRRRIQA